MDRRAFLIAAAGLGVAACTASDAPVETRTEQEIPLDFTELEARYKGRMGLAFAREGVFGQWRGDERFVYCSTFKMYLAAAMMVRAQQGLEDLERQVPITRADMISHAPITEKALGGTLSLKALMKGTVEESDNPAANILIREMGGLEVLRQFYRELGDSSTRVDRLEPEMNRVDGDKDTILPMHSVLNIKRLFLSDVSPLEPASQRLLLEWMVATPTGQKRLKAGMPADWTVAHKTGTGDYGPTNDIGILYPVEGAPIVIAAYFHGGPDSTPDGREAAIAEATGLVLKQLGYGQV